ncbi:hypothetical protein AS038_12670 [Arthrobacter sp. NIO-1057]|nr:hypothetical protein AS038_12670 [Arthrobacter sp. NIO-1057]SCC41376.1 transcriptional regulator, TetR family [Arthrobacter sp. NIO-1057]
MLPGARRRVRTTDSKERLFEAAMELLGSRSPEAVSVDQIAAAAGVSKGTVYYNFGSKDELVSQILEYGAGKLMHQLTQLAKEDDPYQALKSMIEFAMEFVTGYPSFAQLWMQEQLQSDKSSDFAQSPLHRQVTALIIKVLDRLVHLEEAEKLPVASTIFGAALFTARMSSTRRDDLAHEQVVRAILLTVDGLLATRPRTTH